MPFNADYTSSDVPDDVLQLVSLDDSINVDVLSMGPKGGTGLTERQAEEMGLIKNHWVWRLRVQGPDPLAPVQIQFGFSLTETPSVPSNQAQYARSSDRPFDSDSSGPGAISIRSLGSDSGAKFDDLSSIIKPAVELSTIGEQPSMGIRVPGSFQIAVRPRNTPSMLGRFSRSFALAPGTTFGQLFHSVQSRHMEPFYFRQVGLARFGCRDAISQFAAAWIKDGLLIDPYCQEQPTKHIYTLLAFRYSRPMVSNGLTTSDEDEEEGASETVGFRTTSNPLDRAIWPPRYEYIVITELKFRPLDA